MSLHQWGQSAWYPVWGGGARTRGPGLASLFFVSVSPCRLRVWGFEPGQTAYFSHFLEEEVGCE